MKLRLGGFRVQGLSLRGVLPGTPNYISSGVYVGPICSYLGSREALGVTRLASGSRPIGFWGLGV